MSNIKVDCVIGIDPGASGGIAVYKKNELEGRNVQALKMPKDMGALASFLTYLKQDYKPIIFLEKINTRKDDLLAGGAMGKIYRIEKMMENFGALKGVIEGAGIPYVLTHPATWQAGLEIRVKGEEKPERKRRYREIAQKTYPGVKVTLWNADALLIMHYGRWALMNREKWVRANLPERELDKLF